MGWMRRLRMGVVLSFCMGLITAVASAQDSASTLTKPEYPGIWDDIVYGKADAPVEVIEYGSLTCPHCGHFSTTILPRLKEDFIESGQIKFVFRHLIRDRYDLAAAAGSRCLNDMDATKRALASIFAEQPTWLRAENPYTALTEILSKEGLDQAGFGACVSQQSVREFLVQMTQQGAAQYDIKAVPTLIINGVSAEFQDYDDLKAKIEAAIAGKQLSQ